MSREQKNGLVTVTVRIPPRLAEAVVRYKLKHGITVQKLFTESLAEKLGIHPQTGKAIPIAIEETQNAGA
jgi:hypothetical protein